MHNVVAVVVVVVFRCAVAVVVIVFIVVVVGAVVVVIIVSVVLCRCRHRHRRHGMNVRSFVWLLLVFLAIVCWFLFVRLAWSRLRVGFFGGSFSGFCCSLKCARDVVIVVVADTEETVDTETETVELRLLKLWS